MVRLIHITPEPEAKKVRRNGLQPRRCKHFIEGHDRFVWAFPVLESYTDTLQWSRELKRSGARTLAAVTLRIADDEPVFVRHFSGTPMPATAAKAVGIVRAQIDPRGYEVIIPRRVRSCEIVGIRVLPRATGWRYAPNAKNTPMKACDCCICMPVGEVKAARYRAAIQSEMARRGLKSVNALYDPAEDIPFDDIDD